MDAEGLVRLNSGAIPFQDALVLATEEAAQGKLFAGMARLPSSRAPIRLGGARTTVCWPSRLEPLPRLEGKPDLDPSELIARGAGPPSMKPGDEAKIDEAAEDPHESLEQGALPNPPLAPTDGANEDPGRPKPEILRTTRDA